MLDLETLGRSPGCAIVSIGAVKFDREKIKDRFYERILAVSCLDAGLVLEVETVEWWLRQDYNVVKELFEPGLYLNEALEKFAEWLGCDDARIWGNGPAFDNAILRSAYEAIGLEAPWKWWNDRCFRTMKSILPYVEPGRKGTHHNALDDAEYQAEVLIRIFAASRLRERESE